MAYEVVMPRLGWNMETGTLSAWRKQAGEFVLAGEILFEVESEKAIQEVEAVESGILYIPADAPGPGIQLAVGTLLAYLLQPGEELPARPAGPALAGPNPAVLISRPVNLLARPGRKVKAISPRATRVAKELGIDWTRLVGSGRTGRIIERDVRLAAERARSTPGPGSLIQIHASPLAQQLAQELGFDLTHLAAQIPGKRIERADVETAVRSALQQARSSEGMKLTEPAVLPVTPVRRLTAERMAASAHTAAPVTLTTEVDATELVQLRRQLKEDNALHVPTYTDLFICLSARALGEHPELNAHFEGETIINPGTVNIGIAVDTDPGLLVPVIKDVLSMSLAQVVVETISLIEKTRAGRLTPGEMSGGTFTITNLGMYEIDAFTPIINLPECAVLGVGRIVPKQVVIDTEAGRVAIRQMIFLSLTFDHRLVDGAPAARFLQRIKQLVEKPYLWLAGQA